MQSDLEVLPEDLELNEKVGSGAYGQVWKGVWKGRGGGVDVAIKIVELRGRTEQHQAKAFVEVGIPITFTLQNAPPISAFISPFFFFFFFVFFFLFSFFFFLFFLFSSSFDILIHPHEAQTSIHHDNLRNVHCAERAMDCDEIHRWGKPV